MARSRLAVIAGGIVVLMLAACGGGGGGGGGPVEPVFGGNKEAAEVDASNIMEFAKGVMGGAEIAEIIDDVVLYRSSPLAAGTAAAKSSAAAGTPAPPAEHYVGSCGGTLDIVYRVVDESSTHITVTATVTAVGYCEDGSTPYAESTEGYIEDGVAMLWMLESIGGAIDRSVTFTNWSETEVVTGDSMLLNGWINFDWAVGGDPVYQLNMVVSETVDATVEEWWVRDFVLNRNPVDGMTWYVSGNVYYEDQGYVWLETTTPLRLKVGFEAGVVVMNGATTKGKLTHSVSPLYTVELWGGATWTGAQCFDVDWDPAGCAP